MSMPLAILGHEGFLATVPGCTHPSPSQCEMKTPLWTLMLLQSLCATGHCDCQRDCVSCGGLLPQHQAFNVLVCLMECEDKLTPGTTWDLCRETAEQLQLPSRPVGADILTIGKEEEEASRAQLPEDLEEGGLLYTKVLERFRHAAEALGTIQSDKERQTAEFLAERLASNEDEGVEEQEEDGLEEEDEVGVGAEGAGVAASLSKRFGGFLKGKHGYRKLMDYGRPLHKRYGGFIGIRKSARKWNNQKRFGEFLKHYLSMSSRSSKYNSLSTNFKRPNEV
ncbi:hypothetical protein GJAV_G00122220 [Gymnothorax javanicus]|nr:hypothetical protein GJAV_G00122220 [Gymnothorax javanicus]